MKWQIHNQFQPYIFWMLSLLVMLSSANLSAQTSLKGIQERLLQNFADSVASIHKQKACYKKLFSTIKTFRDKEIEMNTFVVSVDFGFSGNITPTSELFKTNGGIELTKSSYPEEFRVKARVSIQSCEGSLEEELSDFKISYDRFIKTKIKKKEGYMLLEGYSFINKRTDKYLGVNQRFEIGGGLIIAHWRKKLYEKSRNELKEFEAVEIKNVQGKYECKLKGNDSLKFDILNDEELKEMERVQKNIKYSILRQKSTLRLGMLIGFFLELESIVHSDSITIPENTKVWYEYKYPTTGKMRWELRPTIDFRLSDDVSFQIRPYFKLPMFWEWRTKVEGESVKDIRVELPVTAKLEINDRFSIEMEYYYFYDNSPNSVLLNEYSTPEMPVYFTANNKHHFYNYKVSYTFK